MSTTQSTPRATEFPANLWQRDEPLRRAAELIEQSNGRIRAVSFDFFDTIVWRLVAKPIDAFCEMGQRLREQQILKDPIQAQDYEVIRKLAEWKARERQELKDGRREDISIAEIYENLNAVIKEPAKAVETEHGVECDVCMLNPGMASFIRHIHGLGIKALIVSDIYFSADHLRGILTANNFDPAIFDCVLTSCDAGVCKGTGNLFKHALKQLGLQASEVMHIGDNYHADVVGARKVGIRGCHYPQFTNEINTILEREKFMLGGQTQVFSINSLRMLAARYFPQDTDEGKFARMGAMLLGPVLTRFATWACDQYVAAGVRKVGAFMREGELFGELLQREADVRGLDLEIKPLYVNRKATALASLGKLTANGLIDWLERRSTLPIKTILKHLGLPAEVARELPFSVEEKADTKERILKLAEFLFTPKNANLIEAQSREEREKVMDYLKPWLESGDTIGLCDIGYNASAHTQLKRVLDMAGNHTHLLGCYLVTGEGSAARILESLDVRHYFGSFGRPAHLYYAFLRSPAIIEQCFTAPVGTTLGYERQADGTVTPMLDKVLFNDTILRRQHAFKEGVRCFQNLWHSFVAAKPGVLGGKTEVSRRILADIDRGLTPILGRTAAFPLPSEINLFGSLPLDDQYFADSFKPMCSEADCDKLRKIGYMRLLGEAGVHWPQGIHELTNRHAAANFFSYGKAMLHCNPEKDNEGLQAELTIVLPAGRNPMALRECLKRVKSISDRSLQYEVFVLVAKDDKESLAVLQEFPGDAPKLHVLERTTKQSPIEVINKAADLSSAQYFMFLDEGTLLPAGWDTTLLAAIRASKDMGMVFPRITRGARVEDPLAVTWRGFIVRRLAFIESLGLNEELAPVGAMWQLALHLQESNWRTEFVPQAVVEAKFAETAISLASYEKALLKKRFANFEQLAKDFSARVITQDTGTDVQRASSGLTKVDWIGSFLDAGSLSHVNRQLTNALAGSDKIKLNRVNTGGETSPAFKKLANEISKAPSADAAVTIRHAWPPDWTRPKTGKLVVVQPWEFGSLPEQWVKDLTNVDEAWVPSEYVRNVYIDSGVPGSKVFVVPNAVDTRVFHPQAAPMKLQTNKKFKFLFVGGTIFRKGPDVLLKAYLDAFTAADDVCLVIKDFGGKTVYAGQTFEEKIRAAQAQPNAPEILYLNDELAPEALPGLYRACDCLVLPYRGEGYGLPVVEAMACGLPVMVTAGGATDDFVRDSFGYRIPSQRQIFGNEISGMRLAKPGWLLEPNAAALTERMKWIAAHPNEARERGRVASEHAKHFCSWESAREIVLGRIEALTNTRTEVRTPETAPAKRGAVTLPACALVGHVGEARELLRQKKFRAAWESTLAALAKRPFHPEAFLLLAEIALAVNDGDDAKLCADHARRIAPEFKNAKKFLNQRLKGNNRPEWLKLPDQVHGSQSTVRSRLSVCLIVKNEEKFLGQCLKSVREVAQQIVVVDTGSTDRTVEIAKEFGAEVHSFKWCDDFSAARNAALEHATGDWVLALDADEELSAKDLDALRQAMSDATTMAWRLPIVDVGRELDGCSYVPRLFRNGPGLFYLGRVHEQIFTSIEVRRAEWGLENQIGEATLIHHGYTQELVRDRNKIERNLQLLEKAVNELPDEPHLLMNLGLELSRSGRETEAFARYQEAFESLSSKPAAEVVPELRESLLAQYCTRLTAAKRLDETIRVLTSPLARSGTGLTASLHFSLGLAHLELKQFSEAADQMRQCLAKRGQKTLSTINRDILTAAPHHCLAVSLAQLGKADEAEKAFQAGLKELNHVDALRLDYARFLFEQKRAVDALHQLNDIVTRDPRNANAWRLGGQIALSSVEFLEFARDWTHESMGHLPEDAILIAQRAEALMLSEDTAGARPLWEKLWNNTRKPHALAALILCEAAEGIATHKPEDNKDELAASRAFIEWYQKLFAARAQKTLTRVMEQMNAVSAALPSGAKILGAAMAEANKEAVGT